MTVRVRVPYLRWRRCLWEPYSQSRCCYGCEETENEVACCSLHVVVCYVVIFLVMTFLFALIFKGCVHLSYAEAGFDLSMIVSPWCNCLRLIKLLISQKKDY